MTDVRKPEYAEASVEPYRRRGDLYVFPFAPAMMPSRRVAWGLELVVRPPQKDGVEDGPLATFSEILLFAKNTDDPRYRDGLGQKVFRIGNPTAEFYGVPNYLRAPGQMSFFAGVIRVAVCEEHNLPVLIAYPRETDRYLVVGPMASLGSDIYFTDKDPT